jgi:hypothetical protein
MKHKIYISKRCQHCRKLLVLLKQKGHLQGKFTIVSIDNEPFPNVIKSVPSMIVGEDVWESDRIFHELSNSETDQSGQQKSSDQPQGGQGNGDDEIMGYCENGICYTDINDKPLDVFLYEDITNENHSIKPIDVSNDGYNKSDGLSGDYDKLMEERNQLNQPRKIL